MALRAFAQSQRSLGHSHTLRKDDVVSDRNFLHTEYEYLIFYPGIENLILPMISNQCCHVSATYISCIGTHAHGRQVTSLLG